MDFIKLAKDNFFIKVFSNGSIKVEKLDIIKNAVRIVPNAKKQSSTGCLSFKKAKRHKKLENILDNIIKE